MARPKISQLIKKTAAPKCFQRFDVALDRFGNKLPVNLFDFFHIRRRSDNLFLLCGSEKERAAVCLLTNVKRGMVNLACQH